MHERLDPAGPRREVVGDDQDLWHLARIITVPGRRKAAGGPPDDRPGARLRTRDWAGRAAQGRAALSRLAAYQPASATFSTNEPVVGASIR